MPPDTSRPDDPREWIRRARGNVLRARADVRLEGVYLEDLCFDAQQAAEKAIKAVLIHRRIRFPYVHDLRRLLELVEKGGVPVPEEVRQADELTDYAAAIRYPAPVERVTREEYDRAIAIAEAVLAWAEARVGMNP